MYRPLLQTIALIAAIGLAAPALATTYLVDPDGGGFSTTIQPAIDAAASGDTVLVAPAHYTGPGNVNLDFEGRNLLLLAQAGPEATVIDGEGSARVLWFRTGEDTTAVVDGFTMTDAPVGSTIRIFGSRPTVRNCVLRGNHATGIDGAAIHIANASPRFQDCLFVENSTTGNGGGVYVWRGDPRFIRCTVIGNQAGGQGGGFYLEGSGTTLIAESTISGNWAEQAAGGGLYVDDAHTVALTRTILWGNYAGAGDDLVADLPATATFTCCVVDAGGAVGSGVVYAGVNLFGDPHFCRPAYCQDEAWSNGDYTLAANSPCLPLHSPCGQLIGAQGQGCDEVAVFVGGPQSREWHLAVNWSTGRVPEPGDHVQLTRGDVVLRNDAEIARLTFCPESSVSDTFFVRDGAVLTVIDAQALEKVEPTAAEVATSGVTMFVDGGGVWNDPLDEEDDGCINTGRGTIILRRFFLEGNTPFLNLGSLIVDVEAEVLLECELLNQGEMLVDPTATVTVAQTLVNEVGGGLHLEGNLDGAGLVENYGLLDKTGPGANSVLPAIVNGFDTAQGERGTVLISAGQLTVGDLSNDGIVNAIDECVLTINGTMVNDYLVRVGAGADLGVVGFVENRTDVLFELAGNLTDAGFFTNLGVLEKTGAGASTVTPTLVNRFDTAQGERGTVLISDGTLSVGELNNFGVVTLTENVTLNVTGGLQNYALGEIGGTGVLANDFWLDGCYGIINPGFSPGALGFQGEITLQSSSRFLLELGGTDAGTEHDQLNVVGAIDYGGAMHVELIDSFFPEVGDSFVVVTVDGNVPAARLRDLPAFDCFSGLQLPGDIFLEPIDLSDRVVLVARDTTVANDPPVAVPDVFETEWADPLTLTPLDNDTDPDGDDLFLVRLATEGMLGVAFIDSGATTITYLPPVAFTGTDSLRYVVTDCQGAVDQTLILIEVDNTTGIAGGETPAADRLHPNAPNPFNPVTRIRYELASPGPASLIVYDVRGRRVITLASGHHERGSHVRDWWGEDERGRPVAAGVYLLRLETATRAETRKMALVK